MLTLVFTVTTDSRAPLFIGPIMISILMGVKVYIHFSVSINDAILINAINTRLENKVTAHNWYLRINDF